MKSSPASSTCALLLVVGREYSYSVKSAAQVMAVVEVGEWGDTFIIHG